MIKGYIMPSRKEHPDDLIIKQQEIFKNKKTNPGMAVTAGEIANSDWDSKNWRELQEDYSKMRISDAVIAISLNAIKMPILRIERKLEAGRNTEEARFALEYIEYVFDNLIGGFQELKYHLLLAIDYGVVFFEKIIQSEKYEGKLTNRIVDFSPIQNDTIEQFYYDRNLIFTGIQHQKRIPESSYEYVDISANELLWLTYNSEYRNILGNPILRPVRLAWDCKQRAIKSTTINIQHGAGIPYAKTKGTLHGTVKNNLEKALRTIGTGANHYMMLSDDIVEKFDLIEPKSQKDVMPFLEFLNRDILLNTTTEFLTSGIGQNGSRAATSEHKSAFELTAGYIVEILENKLQQIIDESIRISFLSGIDKADYPKAKLGAISQTDYKQAAESIKMLVESGIVSVTPQLTKHINDMFGYPQSITIGDEVENKSDDQVNEEPKQLSKNTRELTKHEREIFELESARNHFETITEKIENVIDEMLNKILLDAYEQIKINRKNTNLNIRYEREFVHKLKKLYNDGLGRGINDVKKELSKLNKNIELSNKQDKKAFSEKSIQRYVKRFYANIKATVEEMTEKATDTQIEKAGGLKEYTLKLHIGFKGERRTLITKTANGYIDGRGLELQKNQDSIKTYLYTAVLDRNICNVCAKFDGLVLTKEEIFANDLSFVLRVNGNCEGFDRCRCMLIPYEI